MTLPSQAKSSHSSLSRGVLIEYFKQLEQTTNKRYLTDFHKWIVMMSLLRIRTTQRQSQEDATRDHFALDQLE